MIRRRGIFITESAIALGLIGFIAASLSLAVVRQNRASQRLENTRQATRLTEQALLSLQVDQVPFPSGDDISIRISGAGVKSSIPGWTWMRVDTQYHGASSGLAGLVREDLVGRATAGGNP